MANGGAVCERVFSADWACLEHLDVVCETGCEIISLVETREALVRLGSGRPIARIQDAVEKGTELVRCEGGVCELAELWAFE